MKDYDSTPKWVELEMFLRELLQALLEYPLPQELVHGKPFEFYYEMLFEKEWTTAERTDELVRYMLTHGPEPAGVDEWDYLFLVLRLHAASLFCYTSRAVPGEALLLIFGGDRLLTVQQVAEALLTSLWRRSCDEWLKLYALHCSNGTRFFRAT